jgi:hypothetical protein
MTDCSDVQGVSGLDLALRLTAWTWEFMAVDSHASSGSQKASEPLHSPVSAARKYSHMTLSSQTLPEKG